MLVLSRKVGDKILVGEGDAAVTVEVLEIRGGVVRLGVVADRKIPVLREELTR